MKYTALIVTFNRLGKLKKTVEETLKLEFTNIVIVNNGSTDGTQAWLSSIVDTRVIVLTLTENTGGAGGFSLHQTRYQSPPRYTARQSGRQGG